DENQRRSSALILGGAMMLGGASSAPWSRTWLPSTWVQAHPPAGMTTCAWSAPLGGPARVVVAGGLLLAESSLVGHGELHPENEPSPSGLIFSTGGEGDRLGAPARAGAARRPGELGRTPEPAQVVEISEQRPQGPVVRLRPQREVSKQCRTAFRHYDSSEVETEHGVVSIQRRSVECRGAVACPGTGAGTVRPNRQAFRHSTLPLWGAPTSGPSSGYGVW